MSTGDYSTALEPTSVEVTYCPEIDHEKSLVSYPEIPEEEEGIPR